MIPSRIYDIYPSLTKQKVNLILSNFISRCPTALYSFGFRSYHANNDYFRDCPINCPVRTRRSKALPGISLLRWGSHTGHKDQGDVVSPTDGLENDNFTWSLSRTCDNHKCEYFGKWISLHNELRRAVAKGDSDSDSDDTWITYSFLLKELWKVPDNWVGTKYK